MGRARDILLRSLFDVQGMTPLAGVPRASAITERGRYGRIAASFVAAVGRA